MNSTLAEPPVITIVVYLLSYTPSWCLHDFKSSPVFRIFHQVCFTAPHAEVHPCSVSATTIPRLSSRMASHESISFYLPRSFHLIQISILMNTFKSFLPMNLETVTPRRQNPPQLPRPIPPRGRLRPMKPPPRPPRAAVPPRVAAPSKPGGGAVA